MATKEENDAWLASFPSRGGRKMNFPDACAAFYAIKKGMPYTIVAKAFGVSTAAMSLLMHCEHPTSGGRWHYREIAEEWRLLGEQAFHDEYFTDDVRARLKRIEFSAVRPSILEPGDIRTHVGANPKAASHAGIHDIDTPYGDHYQIEIAFRQNAGWTGPRHREENSEDPDIKPRWAWRPWDTDPNLIGFWSTEFYVTSYRCYQAMLAFHEIIVRRKPYRKRSKAYQNELRRRLPDQ